jgi:hypothetical protein
MADSIKETNEFVAEMTKWHGRALGQAAVDALQKNDFDAYYFETGAETAKRVLQYIKAGDSVAFGGSQTAKQIGLPEMIELAGAKILDHNAPNLDMNERIEIMRQQQVCNVFICSSNALTLDGALYNVDGNGNRVSAMVFGPKKVIIIAGTNKICKDEDAAWERIRLLAAPINMKRLNRPNPCTVGGYCKDCNLKTRGCNAYMVLRKKPSLTDLSVFIVNESLGF